MGSTKVGKQKRLLEHNILAQPLKVFKHSESIGQKEALARGCWKTDSEFINEKPAQLDPWNSDKFFKANAAGGQGASNVHHKEDFASKDQVTGWSRLQEAAEKNDSAAFHEVTTDSSAAELEKFLFLAILQNVLKAQKVQGSMPFPVFLVDKEVDLFLLCQKVREVKGYQNMSVEEWGQIAALLGFTTCYGPSLKVIYAKYLKPLESRDVLEFHGGKVTVMLVNMIEKLIVEFSCNNNNREDSSATTHITDSEPSLTPKSSECEKVQATRQALCSIEPKYLVNKSCEFDALAPQLHVSRQRSGLGTPESRQQEESNEYLSNRVSNESTVFVDRTRYDHLKSVVHWIKRVALNPGDANKGQGPRVSRQNKQLVDECNAITCRIRACLWKRGGAREGNTISCKAEHVNFSRYYDEAFYEDHMILKSHQLSGFHGRNRSSRLFAKALVEITDQGMPRKRVPIGPDFQAILPPCMQPQPYQVSTPSLGHGHEEEVDRWLGTQVWPCLGGKRVVNMERIGRGRPFTCSCAYSVSSACHRLHIRAEKQELMLELGDAFYIWGFDEMGESSLARWTMWEQENFQVIVKTNPASAEKNFWDELPTAFPARSMKDLVSYYFNIYVLRGREIQNRLHSEVIDSDDDEDEISNSINKKSNLCT